MPSNVEESIGHRLDDIVAASMIIDAPRVHEVPESYALFLSLQNMVSDGCELMDQGDFCQAYQVFDAKAEQATAQHGRMSVQHAFCLILKAEALAQLCDQSAAFEAWRLAESLLDGYLQGLTGCDRSQCPLVINLLKQVKCSSD
jgi:hypothetical protein